MPPSTIPYGHFLRAVDQLRELFRRGSVKVIITEEFAFADAAKALAKGRDGHVRAKILLKIGG